MRVGVDCGGTFTDFIAWDGSALRSLKVRSTPHDPSSAILEGLANFVPAEVIHGATVATNALLQRTGARTAFVTTKGFEDLLELARQNRASLYDWMPAQEPSIVPAALRFGVGERTLSDGSVLLPLRRSDLEGLVHSLAGAESVAVCLLHSYANPQHEQLVGKALRGAGLEVSLSSEILPEYREYERAATTVVNAYVTPLVGRYMQSLERALPGVRLRIFQSNGGSASVSEASAQAVRTVLSGPAGGVVGAGAVARSLGIDRFISLDMGGTSTDVSLFDGSLSYTTEGSAAGLPVRVPMLDIVTTGAGGGSIARIDEGAALRVGPRSAGAAPGPVCYGTGEDLTVTDANLLLGRIDVGSFPSGTIRLDADRAREFAQRTCRAAGLRLRDFAMAVVRTANAKMERAIRAVSVERGHRPRDYALISFGGAGPLHACELADSLEIERVVVPAHAGVLSALGMLVADCVRDYSASVLSKDTDAEFARLEVAARADMESEGFHALALTRSLDMRYVGQSYELEVPCEQAGRFDDVHRKRFGYCHQGRPTEAVTARVRAVGQIPGSAQPDLAAASSEPRYASVYIPDGWRARTVAGSSLVLERTR